MFDCAAFFAALDAQRRKRGIDWNELAVELSQQSSVLNARLMDQAICPGAVVRVNRRGTISCQYAMSMLRWLGRAPEDFLTGPVVDVGDVRLPAAGPESRLRWDLNALYTELDEQRTALGLTWVRLAGLLGCTPSRLTNLRTARLADMDLAMRITQWLKRPAAAFIHPAPW
ncbi:MAG: hypothetical protein ABI949_08165 [Ilumatobacteraceae bacterium]